MSRWFLDERTLAIVAATLDRISVDFWQERPCLAVASTTSARVATGPVFRT